MDKHPQEKEIELSSKKIKRRTFFSFLAFGTAAAAGISGWNYLRNQPKALGILKPLRIVLQGNEKITAKFFSNKHLAREYPKRMAAKKARVNGLVGIEKKIDLTPWKLEIHPLEEKGTLQGKLTVGMDDIKSFPKKDMVYEFKCVEGWSQISHWGGVVFSDLMKKYRLGTKDGKTPDPENQDNLYKYVGLKTPDNKYYVGIDMKSMMHPQTILAYELNENPLSVDHGFPLRLIIPVKYGTKNLKCIGSIYFSDTPPADYWYERGYDYDCAL